MRSSPTSEPWSPSLNPALAGFAALMLAALPASARPLEDIEARGVIKLCAPPNALPFAAKRGARRGVQIELAEALAEKLGVELDVEWVTLSHQYRRVDCDIVMDTIVDREAQSESRLKWSKPYQRTGVALAVRAGLEGITGFSDLSADHRVGVLPGALAHMILQERGLRTLPFAFEDELIAAVARGELDAAAATATTIGYYNLTHPDSPVGLHHAYEEVPELAWSLAVGMRRSDRFLRKAVDRIVGELLTEGLVARVYRSYGIEHRPPDSVGPERVERKSTLGEEDCVRLGYMRACSRSRPTSGP